jgi:UDP-4-amino-4,6-dideoxy-N-acetyl-beta-L-altrosamine transaminase
MTKPPIPYGRQHISQDDIEAVTEVLKSDFLTQGPKIQAFEEKFAEYVGSKYAVAVSNGTAALHLSALALDVKPGDKVITTPITFAASANSVLYCGGEIDFSDIDPDTFLIDLDKLEEKLEGAPKGSYKGIIPVDFAGLPVNTEKLRKIADKYGLWIIEDACHAPGGYFMNSKDEKVHCGNGRYADLSIFSFHPVKHIATGEGGMITTNDKALYENLLMLRTHGITKDPDLLEENHGGWYYEMQTLGYNYRLPDLSAALGKSQLRKADAGLERRRKIAAGYTEAFQNSGIKIQGTPAGFSNAYHLFVIRTSRRKELYNFLRENNIFAQVHYIPVHLQPYYKSLGFKKGDFPNAEKYYEECLSLPMYPSLKDDEQEYVIDTILNFILKQV